MAIWTQSAPAKINLTLDILGRRPDGYHEMRMVMQTVSICDKITLENTGEGFAISARGMDLPAGTVTLEQRAAEAFFFHTKQTMPGLRVWLEKRIPAYAGLGGGSADVAALLRLLRENCAPRLSPDRLEQIGLSVGSDVPFCIRGGTALAEGRGELLTDLPPLPPCHFVICKPDFDLPTPQMFARLRLERLESRPDTGGMAAALAAGDLEAIARRISNVFETVLEAEERREIDYIKDVLLRCGGLGAAMSGSGPSVFGLFREEAGARWALEVLSGRFGQCFLAQPVSRLL